MLAREGHLGGDVRIVSINLTEPAKSLVEGYKPRAHSNVRALAVLMDRGKRNALRGAA